MPHKTSRASTASTSTSTIHETGVQVGKIYLLSRQDSLCPAEVLELRTTRAGLKEAYISFVGEDKRLDAWVPEATIKEAEEVESATGPSQEALIDSSRPSKTVDAHLVAPTGARSSSHPPPRSEISSPEREHEILTRVRNFEDVRFGEFLIKTWYFSPYPIGDRASSPGTAAPAQKKRKLNGTSASGHELQGANGIKREQSVQEMYAAGRNKAVDGANGRLWVCDLCFKYMSTRGAWERHTTSCDMLTPPGRRVYQKDNYSMWEVDGAVAPLYCQNLCLFGKLFIDHKSVFYYVENFLFYVVCDAATSRRDQVMAFFSKEKISYDDYNLACIITFPPYQSQGFGKLLIEFSYYLTLHPSTRPASLSPGTPERPLSDLGLKGYTAYWVSVILRFCRQALEDAPPIINTPTSSPAKVQRARRVSGINGKLAPSSAIVQGVQVVKMPLQPKGQYAISLTLSDLARACHLRVDDVVTTLTELGFLRHRRELPVGANGLSEVQHRSRASDANASNKGDEWTGIEVVITRDAVEREWEKWNVRPKGMLDETCVLL